MAQKNRGIVFFFSCIITCLLILAGISFCSAQDSNMTTTGGQIHETKEFFLTETEGGEPKWDIKAISAEFRSEGKVFLNKVKINLYENGEKFLNIKAEQGVFNKITKNVHLEGNVIGVSNRGESFFTQRLDWISEKGKIFTNDKIKIAGQGLLITALGMEIFPAHKTIILKENIKAEVYRSSGDSFFKFGRQQQ